MRRSRRRLVNINRLDCTPCTTRPARFGDCAPWRPPPGDVTFDATRLRSVNQGCGQGRNRQRGAPMATESVAVSGAPASSHVVDKGLKKNAIGYISNVVIGVAS